MVTASPFDRSQPVVTPTGIKTLETGNFTTFDVPREQFDEAREIVESRIFSDVETIDKTAYFSLEGIGKVILNKDKGLEYLGGKNYFAHGSLVSYQHEVPEVFDVHMNIRTPGRIRTLAHRVLKHEVAPAKARVTRVYRDAEQRFIERLLAPHNN